MADDAGFAVAITIRERVLNDAILVAYSSGDLGHTLKDELLGGPPGEQPKVSLDVFLAPPRVTCKADNAVRVAIRMRGALKVTLNDVEQSGDVDAHLTLRIRFSFLVMNHDLVLQIRDFDQDVILTDWGFEVVSGDGFSPDADNYLRGTEFRERLRQSFALAIGTGRVRLPRIDISFLGPVLEAVNNMTAQSRVVDKALLIGLDVASDDVTTAGSVSLLADFARVNDVAAVTNRVAVPILLGKVKTIVKKSVERAGATLDDLQLTPQEGKLHVAFRASKFTGSAKISFNLIPTMFATRPGNSVRYRRRSVFVKPRFWPALGFMTADIDVDVDPAEWLDIVTGLFALVLPVVASIVADMASSLGDQFRTKIAGAQTGVPVPRVQRRKPSRPGGVGVRIAIEEYVVSTAGTYIGITVRPLPPPGVLIGPTTIPSDYRGEELTYTVRLPLAVRSEDPDLRIRWTVIDPSGTVLVTEDDVAAGRDLFTLVPDKVAHGLSKLVIGVRVYRTLGAQITEILNDSIGLTIRGPLAPGAYIRWYHNVANPQLVFDDASQSWFYNGDLTVKRHSNWHRTDRPCANLAKSTHATRLDETRDTLPFPLAFIDAHRSVLCDYCFYGGPAGLRASL